MTSEISLGGDLRGFGNRSVGLVLTIQTRPSLRPRSNGCVCAGFRIPAPLMIYPPVLRGRCPKPFREGTRGVWQAARGLWGFDGAAVWVRVVLAGVVGGRSTIAIDNFSPPLPSSR